MKRTKQAQRMIDAVNYYLKANNVNDPYCDVVCAFEYSLLKSAIYEGYNFYKRKQIGDQEVLVLIPNQEKSDCLQFL